MDLLAAGRLPQWTCCVVVVAAIVFVAGCVPMRPSPTRPERPISPQLPAGPRYEPAPGQDAKTVAEMRAAPPPREPEVSGGSTPAGDESVLTARGFVRIGSGYFPGRPDDVQDWAQDQGRRVGAEKVLTYAGAKDGQGLRVDFYVRYRLPFGATFRSLTPPEREALESGGVQLGEIVGGTPAAEANLRRGDFIVRFNGEPIADRPAFEHLLRQHLGQRVTLTVRRNGVTLQRLVRLGVVAGNARVGRE